MMPVFYVPINYPNSQRFFELLDVLEEFAVSIIEIGIPVKNPYQDGSYLKKINHDLLTSNLTHHKIIELLQKIKETYNFKVILMTYEEGVSNFKLDKIDTNLYEGILCVNADLSTDSFPNQVKLISPDMNDEKINSEIASANVFIYLTSFSGKTGETISIQKAPYKSVLKKVKSKTDVPVFVGFGIKNYEDTVAIFESGADGVIIGTEFLKKYDAEGIVGIEKYLHSFQ